MRIIIMCKNLLFNLIWKVSDCDVLRQRRWLESKMCHKMPRSPRHGAIKIIKIEKKRSIFSSLITTWDNHSEIYTIKRGGRFQRISLQFYVLFSWFSLWLFPFGLIECHIFWYLSVILRNNCILTSHFHTVLFCVPISTQYGVLFPVRMQGNPFIMDG